MARSGVALLIVTDVQSVMRNGANGMNRVIIASLIGLILTVARTFKEVR